MTEYYVPVSELRIHRTGRKARLCDTDSDENLFFCTADPDDSKKRLDEIQSFGTDFRSLCDNPQFVDAENGNFQLKPESPVHRLGFKPLPLDNMFVGNKPKVRD